MPDCREASALCCYLEWDSQFFGLRIARANVHRLTVDTLHEMQSWCDSQRIDCLYFLADCDDAKTVELAEQAAFHLVDVRVTLSMKAASRRRADQVPSWVRAFRAEDLPILRGIARVSHRDSRFYYDGNFPHALCDGLYETWIEKSTQEYAQAVLVAEFQNQAAGYITCHRDARAGQIGLFAVAGHAQGRGLGQQLVLAAVNWFEEQKRSEVTVATQGRNVRGQRLYQKCGFSTRSVQLWYHYWRALPAQSCT
jgi:dTDP-4-amino-4,6-dideoxy-D-galactose acyltransferase